MAPEMIIIDPEGDLTFILHDLPPSDESPQCPTKTKQPDSEDTTPKILSREIHMVASSKHMMFASPVFKAMLKNYNFKEGQVLRDSGTAQVELPEDNPVAFKIFLDIIHGRGKHIPIAINLELLSGMAVLVDKYQVLDPVEIYAATWAERIKLRHTPPPISLDSSLLSWISISWVFKMSMDFHLLTGTALRDSTGNLEQYMLEDLPIPNMVFEAIECRRQAAIADALAVLVELIGKFHGSCVMCPGPGNTLEKNACDGMVLGTLLRSATKQEIWPPPVPPYEGLTLRILVTKIRTLEVSARCGNNFSDPSPLSIYTHGVMTELRSQMERIESCSQGLHLADFS